MKRSVLTSTLLSCAVFSCLTAPLAVFGSNLINIQLQRENIFAGRLKDVATPYLGFAGLVSLGAGAVSFSLAEWRRSARKSNQVETQLNELKNELKEKASQIDDLLLSDAYLSNNGFQSFLQSNLKQPQNGSDEMVRTAPVQVAQPAVSSIAIASASKPFTVSSPSVEEVSPQPLPRIVEAYAFDLPKSHNIVEHQPRSVKSPAPEVLTHLSNLQNQMKQIEAQIAALQSSLETPVVEPESPDPYNTEIQYLHRRLQLLELDWIRHQTAS